jgi:hypothetical protein
MSRLPPHQRSGGSEWAERPCRRYRCCQFRPCHRCSASSPYHRPLAHHAYTHRALNPTFFRNRRLCARSLT